MTLREFKSRRLVSTCPESSYGLQVFGSCNYSQTPHYMMYGWDPVPLTKQFLEMDDSVYAETPSFASYHAQTMRLAWQIAQRHICEAQQKMTKQHNKHSFEPKIKIGDKVFITRSTQIKGQCRKLAPQFSGPFRVV